MNLLIYYYNKVLSNAFNKSKIYSIRKYCLLVLTIFSTSFLNAQITSYPYEEDFETSDGGWTVKGTTTTWERGTPDNNMLIASAYSGNIAWVTNLDGFYVDLENGWVESPAFDLSSLSSPYIEFGVWWSCENGFDGGVIQSSVDGGVSWQNIGVTGDEVNWFNDIEIDGNPGGQRSGWTGGIDGNGSNNWVIAGHTLSHLTGETSVIFRLAFGSDINDQEEGIAFDLIKIFDADCKYAGENGSLETCGGISDEDLFDELGGFPDDNGVWTHPSGGEIGVHTYTFSATVVCPESTATVTVTQTPLAFAGGSNEVSYGGEEIDLYAQLKNSDGSISSRTSVTKNAQAVREPDEGGVWLDEDDEEIPTGKVSFPDLPAGSYSKFFYYTVDGNCGSEDDAVIELIINIPFDIGSNATLEICKDANLTEAMLFDATGGDPNSGGFWDPVLDGANTYIYDHNGDTVEVIVTEVTPKSAGQNGTFVMNPAYTLTENDLFMALGNTADADGEWTPAIAGVGTYTYTHAGPCPETSAQVVVSESALRVDDIERLGIRIFPNPSKGKLFITGELSKIKHLEIYSMYGQRLHVIRKNFKEINIEQLPAALYIVKLFTEEGIGSMKILRR